jgi:hypothetical protein
VWPATKDPINRKALLYRLNSLPCNEILSQLLFSVPKVSNLKAVKQHAIKLRLVRENLLFGLKSTEINETLKVNSYHWNI